MCLYSHVSYVIFCNFPPFPSFPAQAAQESERLIFYPDLFDENGVLIDPGLYRYGGRVINQNTPLPCHVLWIYLWAMWYTGELENQVLHDFFNSESEANDDNDGGSPFHLQHHIPKLYVFPICDRKKTMLWMEEILRQLVDGSSHYTTIICSVS